MVKDKVIVVTGASQGLGRALSVKLSGMGAKVAVVARNEKLLYEVRQQLKAEGGEVEMFMCDVTNISQVNETVKAIEKKMGTIDILVNGAGIWTTDKFEDSKPELIESAFKVNSIGPIYFTKAVLPIFRKNNHGHLFFVISKAGLDIPDNKDWPTYAATKWAVTGYARALKYALEDSAIKLTCLLYTSRCV